MMINNFFMVLMIQSCSWHLGDGVSSAQKSTQKHVSAIKQMLNVNKLKFWPNSSDKSHSIRPNSL